MHLPRYFFLYQTFLSRFVLENRSFSDGNPQRIKYNWRFLKENLVQHEIREIFMKKDIWDYADFEEIDAERTPMEKNEVFLKLLLRSGHRAYDVFIAALQEKGSTHIIEKLQSTLITKNSQKPSGKHYISYVVGEISFSTQILLAFSLSCDYILEKS